MRFLRGEAKTILVAMITAAVTAGGPVIAATVANADKVDGKHAVGSKASLTKAAGKLVATRPTGAEKGKLPGKFVGKVASAANADSLGGQPASTYLGDTLTVIDASIANVGDRPAGLTVDCPTGYTAVGGGVDTPDDVDGLVVAASSPLIETETGPERATAPLAEGLHGKATGWYGAVWNDGASLSAYFVTALCARD